MSKLDKEATVAQWVSERPRTADVFEELQIDYCCGGDVTLSNACASRQLNVDEVLCRLNDTVAYDGQQPSESWLDSGLGELCDHIEKTHHATYVPNYRA